MNDRPTPETDAMEAWPATKLGLGDHAYVPADFARKLERERDEWAERWAELSRSALKDICAMERERDELKRELSYLFKWVERRSQDGFIDSQTTEQNITRCYDALYERLDDAIRERDEAREAILTTLEENRHLADGDDCTLAKLKSVVPDWK